LVLFVLVSLVISSCTSDRGRAPTTSASGGDAPGSTGPELPDLRMRLVRVSGKGAAARCDPRTSTRPPKPYGDLEDLYVTAFSHRPSIVLLFAHFSGDARAEAERQLDRLTLGAVRDQVDEVLPERATLKLTFLADRNGNPIAAFADTEFEASAISEGRRSIAHHGDYAPKLGGDWRIVSYDVGGRVPRTAPMQPRTSRAAFAPGLPSNDPLFVLVIGSDARPGRAAVNARADSIHIVGVNPRLGVVSILGIPRDSWVPIPGSGTSKINAALVRGGPQLMVRTVEQVSGIQIDAFVLTGFVGFERLVDAVGGIDVRIPYAIDDAAAGAHFRRGPEHLNRNEALAFSRARHDVPAGDFSRSLNQGRLMIAALATLRQRVGDGRLTALLAWVLAGGRFLQSDLELSQI
jgi:LCP family protein required for cell wall assembly